MSESVRWLLLLEASKTPESPATDSSLTEGGVVVSQMGDSGGDMLPPRLGRGASYAGGGATHSPLSNRSTLTTNMHVSSYTGWVTTDM